MAATKARIRLPVRRDGDRDHHEDEGVVGAVEMVPAGNEEEGHGDRRRHGHGPLEGRPGEQCPAPAALRGLLATHASASPDAEASTS